MSEVSQCNTRLSYQHKEKKSSHGLDRSFVTTPAQYLSLRDLRTGHTEETFTTVRPLQHGMLKIGYRAHGNTSRTCNERLMRKQRADNSYMEMPSFWILDFFEIPSNRLQIVSRHNGAITSALGPFSGH